MARYLDTGAGDKDHCVGIWLETAIAEGLREFRTQVGYFRYAAIDPFAPLLRARAESGSEVHFVIGSNRGALSGADLASTLRIVEATDHGSLVVVSYSNALFHPKCIHIRKANGSSLALIGSGNMTEGGMGKNVEAAVVLDEEGGDAPDTLGQIEEAINRWRGLTQDGVFLIESEDDIHQLALSGIIDTPQPAAPLPRPVTPALPPGQDDPANRRFGTRPRLWRPRRRRTGAARRRVRVTPVAAATPAPAPPVAVPAPAPVPTPAPAPAPVTVLPHFRWCKQMPSSDAQWVLAGTNPTGKLRLAQAGFSINRNIYFRYELFASAAWGSIVRAGNPHDIADVDFDVTVSGVHIGPLTLRIDHAPHREASQDNVPTVLAWGPRLGAMLGGTSHVGDWVVIERDTAGQFHLTIQQNRPTWAP